MSRQGLQLSAVAIARIRKLVREGERTALVAERIHVTPNTVRRHTKDLRILRSSPCIRD
jgi:hypothetical protein